MLAKLLRYQISSSWLGRYANGAKQKPRMMRPLLRTSVSDGCHLLGSHFCWRQQLQHLATTAAQTTAK
eukprot:6174723-Pleurochrysis_carterae.AAC.1